MVKRLKVGDRGTLMMGDQHRRVTVITDRGLVSGEQFVRVRYIYSDYVDITFGTSAKALKRVYRRKK